MSPESREFLTRLLETPSPSGYERPVQNVVREFVGKFADDVRTDCHGNVIAAVNPLGSPRIMLDGHCDQIAVMVKHIDDNGFLWVTPIGGWDSLMLIGQHVRVWTERGPLQGVVARKPIHLLTHDERKRVPELKDLWVDIGAANGDEAREAVTIGDPVTFELGLRELRNGLVAGAGMDNKVGVWVVMHALQKISQEHPQAGVFAVSAVQEEIGLRGTKTSAFSIEPEAGIAVDVTHATDCPTVDENQHGRVKLGNGPVIYRGPNVNPVMYERLMRLAKDHEIPVQPNGISRPASNDANAMQLNRSGVATGLVTIPNRYMHSPVEVVSLSDLEHAADLIARFCLTIEKGVDFTP